jgi:hypothetical protein
VLIAAAGTASSCSSSNVPWDSTYDWVCVGSGVGGCCAAIAGHDNGMKTLLLEQTDMIGGSSSQASSTGGLFAPMNRWQREAGIQDTREKALAYLRFVGGGYAQEGHMETYVDNAARILEFFNDKEGITSFSAGTPPTQGFYDPVAPHAAVPGRRIRPTAPFPAAELGQWRDKVRLRLWLRGFVEALEELEGFRSPLSDEGPARTMQNQLEAWKKRVGPAKVDELIRKEEETREGAHGWMAYLFRSVIRREIEVQTRTKVEKLLTENGRVSGLVVNQNGALRNLRANKGVLLALGNSWLGMDVGWGPAWMLAAEVGAKIQSEPFVLKMITIHVPGEVFPNGRPVGRTNYERFMQHSILVNRFGERFDDEAFYSGGGRVVNHFEDWEGHRFRNFPNYFIFDRNLLEKYSFAGMPPGNTQELDWVAQASTISELARKLDISVRGLEATVARFNEFARRRNDMDFKRNPRTLGPLERAPFYGVQTATPDPFSTLTTVATDPRARVLHYVTDKPIPGLYCCGALSTTSRTWGVGYQGGFQFSGGAIFGFLAAEDASQAPT